MKFTVNREKYEAIMNCGSELASLDRLTRKYYSGGLCLRDRDALVFYEKAKVTTDAGGANDDCKYYFYVDDATVNRLSFGDWDKESIFAKIDYLISYMELCGKAA